MKYYMVSGDYRRVRRIALLRMAVHELRGGLIVREVVSDAKDSDRP